MGKASFLSKKSGFMMMETETSNGFGSDKGSTQRNAVVDGGGSSFCGLGLQPYNTSAFKSPVGMAAAAAAAACLRYPFTSAQWQELERQALIFKYMMASIPVPPDLLIPTTRNLSNTSAAASAYPSLGRGPCFNLRFSNGTDPEPGRCRRTDGKKWRCSRDVAPDQKYCERHMHRSRPRSRKHVEVPTDITNSSSTIPPANTTSRSSARPYPQPAVFLPKPLPLDTMNSNTSYKDSRCMDWMLKGDSAPLSNQDLQQMMRGKGNPTTDNHPFFQQQYHENNNLSSYTDFGTSLEGLETQDQSDNCFLFLNPELEPIADQRQMPRRFIDAWSTARDSPTGTNKSNASEKLSPSTLSLSMSSDNGVGEDIDQIQMGLGVMDSECDNAGGSKSQPLSWMTPVSWIGSPPGGPLGEVLQSSNTISQVASKSACLNSICNLVGSRSSSNSIGGLNLMTDDWGGSRDTSPRTTAASSPSGVLHKTLASPSDSSGGNSPTFKAAAARTEIALQWMSQNK